ncbi:TonB-dependent receptor [Mucilaginibacter sp. Bleaf8]|uniref:SusC/RagA family TonB-linked outer membrane protein n=1 Tax=Mucilaginibacter sp. Bleaf8 TaxID=2834430 RepID=UPI001BCA74DB|nr:TonB-dependent receptor [Mucilaginibacter sp. Bleaf8]MBS7566873.1 TonB-dependent receptor [Mucilaginibacter sp. Bleaf8]
MRKKLTLLISFLLCTISFAIAQGLVKGKVTDKAGQPLPGVSIKVQGTTTGTVTGAGGEYTISAQPNGSLIVTYVGFAGQTIAVGDRSVINITLTEETNNLNDVVVVGFGTQKKSVITGAISRVKASDIQDQQVINVNQALQGRTSGVTVVNSSGAPGASAQIRIRGVNSINNSEPLYVVDGAVVLNGGIENINPNDIESFEVLKDASAAIYGSRASNGVILITTKKGKSGAPVLSYNSYIGFQQPVSRVKVANAAQYAALRNQAATNDGSTTLPFADPASYGVGTNWQDQIFKNAMIQNHSLSVQAGTEKSTLYTSFAYLNQKGTVLPDLSNYKRYNFVVNSSSKVKKWLTIGENFNYSYTRDQNNFNTNNEYGGPLSSSLNLDPITPVIYTGPITGIYASNNPLVKNAAGQFYGVSPYVNQEISNPIAYQETVRGNYGWSHNILGNAYAEISPIEGLKIRTQINGKQAFYGSQSYSPLFYLANQANNLANPSAYRASNRNLTWNWDNTISYSRAIDKHNFTVLAGTSAFEQKGLEQSVTYNNIPVSDYTMLSFNYNLPQEQRFGFSSDSQPYHVFSYFGRLTYDYDQKYLFTGIVRRDGSSKFGSNNLYGTFPTAQLGWVVTREDFFPKNSFVDFLKIRASYGVVGNEQSLDYFQYTSVIGSGYNAVFGNNQLVIGNSPNSPSNPNLKWESTRTTDIGFDAVLFKSLNVTVDLYRKYTKDMLQNVPLPVYAGYNSDLRANVGDLENKGIEVELSYNKNFGDVKTNFGFNMGYNHNEVKALGVTPFLNTGSFQNIAPEIFRTQVGQPVASFYGYKTQGIFHSQAEIDAYALNGNKIQPNAKPGDIKFQDTNNNGVIDEADRQFLGSQLPSWTYGTTIGASYKAFDFKIFGQGAWGNKIFQGYRRLDIAGANYPVEALNGWTPTNTGANYPRVTDQDPNKNYSTTSDFYLQSGAYFRIKTLQIGYTVPKNILNKLDIQRVRVYLSSNNLATFTKYNGYDPEIVGGIDRGIYPQSRSFLVGLDITL